MDATNTIHLLTLAETDTVNTPTWALLMVLIGVLVSVAMSAFALVFARKEKSDDRVASLTAENADLREQAVLNEVKAMRVEVNATLAAIKASMERHDDEIGELRRAYAAIHEWKAIIDAALRKGGVLGA